MTNHEEIFISVRNGRAFVSRYVTEDDGSFSWESATNAIELEKDALAAVVAQGGSITQNKDYVCPATLAARAHWYKEC